MPYGDDPNYDPYSQFTRVMRMNNLFQPQPVSMWDNPYSAMPTNTPVPTQDYTSLYEPRTYFTDMYTNAIGQYPQRGEPSLLNKIGGIMAGLGAGVGPVGISGGQPIGFQGNPLAALQTFDQVANAPYYQKMADYTRNLVALRQGAELEDKINTDARIFANNLLQQERADRRMDETERANQSRESISRMRAEAYVFKQNNPSWKSYTDANGRLVFVNPQNPEEVHYTDIDTGKLSDADKINLQIQGRLSAISAQGNQTRQNLGVQLANQSALQTQRNADALSQINARGEQTRRTNQDKAVNPPTAVQQRTAIFNRAQQAKNSKPEWSRWIRVQPNGEVIITPPKSSMWSSGPTAEEHQKINEFIYGASQPVVNNPSVNNEPKVGETKTLPNGKPGTWNGKVWVVQ